MSERRRNWTYVTRNTEYHTAKGRCVAVRDLRTGRWVDNHQALDTELFGTLPPDSSNPRFGETRMGEPLLLVSNDRTFVTSVLLNVYRPERKLVNRRFPQPGPKRSWAAPSQPHTFPTLATPH